MPDLVGMSKEKALALLKQLMLLFEVEEQDVDGVAAGVVASQSPAPGSTGHDPDGRQDHRLQRWRHRPAADRAASPLARESPAVGQAVAFDASSSTDDGEIVAYLWEFGDGSQAEGKNVSHAYENPGTYEITLWVTDDADQTSSVTREITVQ